MNESSAVMADLAAAKGDAGHGAEADLPCECQNCLWSGADADIETPHFWIDDLCQRVFPNEIVPAGECPECGSLAHKKMAAIDRTNLLRILVREGLTFGEVMECMGTRVSESPAAERAVRHYSDDDLQFDDTVMLSEGDGGAWVSCWAWVENPTAEAA